MHGKARGTLCREGGEYEPSPAILGLSSRESGARMLAVVSFRQRQHNACALLPHGNVARLNLHPELRCGETPRVLHPVPGSFFVVLARRLQRDVLTVSSNRPSLVALLAYRC